MCSARRNAVRTLLVPALLPASWRGVASILRLVRRLAVAKLVLLVQLAAVVLGLLLKLPSVLGSDDI